MAFVNYIGALTLTRNNLELRFLKDFSMKTRPSKSKILLWKLIPITHSLYSTTKKPKRVSSNTKVIEGHEPPTASSLEALIRVLSNGVLFRMLSDKVLFRILRDIVLFRVVADRDHRYSAMESSIGFSVVLSSLVSLYFVLFCFTYFQKDVHT